MLQKFGEIVQERERFISLSSTFGSTEKRYVDTTLPHDETLRFDKVQLFQNIADELNYIRINAKDYGFIHILSLAYAGRMLRAAFEVSKEVDDVIVKQTTKEAFEAITDFTRLVCPQNTVDSSSVFILKESGFTKLWEE